MVKWLRCCGLLVALGLLACSSAPPPVGHGRIDEFAHQDLLEGSGEVAQLGQRVSVHYRGWLYDDRAADQRGSLFDSSLERGQVFTFLLGAKQVIRGWDEGVPGMRVGGKRLLRLPPEYGYGSRGAGAAIPADSSLLFEVELLAVKPG